MNNKINTENQVIAKRMALVYGGVWALIAAIQVGIGMAEFYGTNSKLTSCPNCSTCNPDALGTSIVTESFLFFMFLIALIVIFVYEYKKRCRHCHRSGSRVNPMGPTRSQIMLASVRNAVDARHNPQQVPPRTVPEPSAPPSYEEATKN
ncbi:hypothetical protein CHS0354_021037 [Potamilus streckersoni]|uniref:Uncharacterized protein n=1 Tax=Potamilus streckersoni TaxID=2493646 RepID=A0AAE0SD54_9BIVA|nr:hypothetical protein CHS0354_021037 [Potamilus streckersoni]